MKYKAYSGTSLRTTELNNYVTSRSLLDVGDPLLSKVNPERLIATQNDKYMTEYAIFMIKLESRTVMQAVRNANLNNYEIIETYNCIIKDRIGCGRLIIAKIISLFSLHHHPITTYLWCRICSAASGLHTDSHLPLRVV